MPAASDGLTVPELPHTWRPLGARIAAPIFAAILIGAFGFLWFGFDPDVRAEVNWFQRGTVVFMVGTGVFLLYMLARSRVVATDDGLTLVNGFRRRDLEWAEVIAIRLPPGAPWPILDLSDGTTACAMGFHCSDGARARDAVREVKGLLLIHGPDNGLE
jgi:hypothetical protein